ncbi:MAG: hypothetical protein AB7K86_20075 [Rhodospirillales bacterium]
MRRLRHGVRRTAAAMLATVALLAGCAAEGRRDTVTPVAPAGAAGPAITWQTRLSADTVDVTVTDPHRYWRIERLTLVAPGGATVPAQEITRETVRDNDPYGYGYGGSSVGIGGGWGSRGGGGLGIGIGIPLFGSGASAAPPSRVAARIRLPDAAAYRQSAAAWRIRIELTDPNGQTSHAEIPAPVPQG